MTFEQKKRHKHVTNVTICLKMWHFFKRHIFFDIPRGNGYEFFWLKRRICPSKNIAILPKKCNKKNITKNQGFLKMPKNVTFWTENSNLHLYYNFKRWHLNQKNVTNLSQMWHFASNCDIFSNQLIFDFKRRHLNKKTSPTQFGSKRDVFSNLKNYIQNMTMKNST